MSLAEPRSVRPIALALYYLGLSFLFAHELDAVTHSEWRLLFILRNMPDQLASEWFVALHVPLFFGILWLSHHPRGVTQTLTRGALSAFLVAHALLHFLLLSRPENEFDGALSHVLISAAGACGIAYLWSDRGALREALSKSSPAAY